MKLIPTILLASVATLSVSCYQNPASNSSSLGADRRLSELEDRLEEQREQIARLERQQTNFVQQDIMTRFGQSVAESHNDLAARLNALKSTVDRELSGSRQRSQVPDFGFIDTSEKGFTAISCRGCVLLVSVENIVPYLDGHKVTVHLGNPMAMAIANFSLAVRCGKRPSSVKSTADAVEHLAEWLTSSRIESFSFTETLAPGAWTPVTFTLKETKPEDVGYLGVAFNYTQVSLRRPLGE